MLVLDSSDNYAVGNQYFNVVLNPDNKNSYPLRELLSTALDTKGLTYEGDVLFEKPSVGSPMYLIFDELVDADEAFFSGTAVEITPITKVDNSIIGSGAIGPISERLQSKYSEIVCGKDTAYSDWLTYI